MSKDAGAHDRNPVVLLSAVLALNCIFLVVMGWSSVRFYRETKSTRERYLKMEELRGTILRLDETLTMSARMAAATSDPRWEARYRENLTLLDAAIEAAMRLAPEARSAKAANETDAANRKLVAMETRAFDLVREGHPAEASGILQSAEYEEQKQIYGAGMKTFADQLSAMARERLGRIRRQASLHAGVVLALVPCLILSLALVVHAVRRWKTAITVQNRRLAKAYDDLKELDRMKSAFLDVISHELSTPVTCLGGMLEVLQAHMPEGDAQSARAGQSALRGARRLRELLAHILHVAATGSYAEHLDKRRGPLDTLIRETVEEVQPFAHLRRLRLTMNLPEALPAIPMDPEKIRDVLLNLLMNAIKFTPDEGEIEVEAALRGREFVEVSVRDNGIGISTEDQPHVFDAFFTSFNTLDHSSGTYEFEKRGLGLGLAIVAKFVEMHGGQTGLESARGKGTRVWFTLPAGQA